MLFEPTDYISDSDTDTHRTCSVCNEVKPHSEFYKDGQDAKGNPKFRRDCKDCYKSIRASREKYAEKKGLR